MLRAKLNEYPILKINIEKLINRKKEKKSIAKPGIGGKSMHKGDKLLHFHFQFYTI